jgi:hypothetical protein
MGAEDFGETLHPCARERVHVADPTREALYPMGVATKLAIRMIAGVPVFARVQMLGSGITLDVPLTWLSTTPHTLPLPDNVISGPWPRRTICRGANWIDQPEAG